jgi:hypothetical protein
MRKLLDSSLNSNELQKLIKNQAAVTNATLVDDQAALMTASIKAKVSVKRVDSIRSLRSDASSMSALTEGSNVGKVQ